MKSRLFKTKITFDIWGRMIQIEANFNAGYSAVERFDDHAVCADVLAEEQEIVLGERDKAFVQLKQVILDKKECFFENVVALFEDENASLETITAEKIRKAIHDELSK